MSSPASSLRAARLEARIAPDVLATVKRAAEIEGRSVSDFVVNAVRSAAQHTLNEAQILRLSLADQHFVADLLAHPPKPSAALARARKAHKKLIRSSR
ncbi:MAG: DUF1778 domain-containing protein [Proteobacteria bacterium]|nr:DUF1778 domain-containing protein [Pseudomonadota bacterium]